MGSLLRSEEMALCQLFLQSESAYSCVSELGELGLCQFRDLNPDVSAFSRKFVSEVRRCDEMERKLRFIEKEIKKDGIPELDTEDTPDAPAPREVIDLEASFEKLENELKEVNANAEALKKNFLELTELKFVLNSATNFFDEHERSLADDASEALIGTGDGQQSRPLHLGFVAGVITREKIAAFERLLWRACRGNVFLKQHEIPTPLEDPISGDPVHKCVFVIFFQGEQLKTRVKKICEGFRATLYPCPESPNERREMEAGVVGRIEDLSTVLRQTTDHRSRVLVLAAKNIKTWFVKVRKIKAIYHTLNMFNLDVTQKCLIAECWVATVDLDKVQEALLNGKDKSGSDVPSILNRMATSQKPPTFNRTNKFTKVFQTLIDAYGVSTYREVNPAPFSIITFPFLFSVMFGDIGHGALMTLAGLFMVLRERQLAAQSRSNEIFRMIFGGRYLILMMGIFSVYAGFLYNDIFSKSLNLFGSSWKVPKAVYNYTEVSDWPVQLQLTPSPYSPAYDDKHAIYYDPVLDPLKANYIGSPYVFGLDPVWAFTTNKLTFVNSFKMKLSVVFGVTHMLFGVALSLINHVHFSNAINIFCEFIPQVLFLCCMFGYLVFEIFYKWITWSARIPHGHTLLGCSPNLLIGMINMFLMTYEPVGNSTTPENSTSVYCEPANPILNGPGNNFGQMLQTVLLIIVVVCIPWILVPKPLLLWRRGYAKKNKKITRGLNSETDTAEIIHHDQIEVESADAEDHGSAGEFSRKPKQPEMDGEDRAELQALNGEALLHQEAEELRQQGFGADVLEEEEKSDLGEIVVHQCIHTIEYCLNCVSHTASYLRLWALSLAHGQLSEVLWNMVLRIGLGINSGYLGSAIIVGVFPFWAILTIAILLLMEGLSAFLHTLRLHWVEFNSKFYSGDGYAFEPFCFATILEESKAEGE